MMNNDNINCLLPMNIKLTNNANNAKCIIHFCTLGGKEKFQAQYNRTAKTININKTSVL